MIPAIFPNKNDTRLEYPFTNEKCLMLLCSLAGIPSGKRSHSWLEYKYIYISLYIHFLIGNTSTQSGAPIFQVSAMLDDPGVWIFCFMIFCSVGITRPSPGCLCHSQNPDIVPLPDVNVATFQHTTKRKD